MIGRSAFACAVFVLLASSAGAQDDAPADPAADIAAHRAALDAITQDIAVSKDREDQLRQQIDALDRDRASLNQNLIDAGRDVQRMEGQLDDAEAKLGGLLTDEDKLRASLAGRREVLGQVLAALQRMGDHPPPALLVRPEDALSAVRSAILLGAVVPSVRGAADALAADLARLVALRTSQEQARDRLKSDAEALMEGRTRIALLIEDKGRERDQEAAALTDEQQRAADLATQATSLRDLLNGLDTAKSANPPGPQPNAPGTPRPSSLGNSDRLAPAVAFVDAKGLLPMPANGKVVTAFGESNGLGGKAQGISITTRAGAEVTSPADGWVAYAGPFRSYGQLLIINAGGGYHVILAGMDRMDVQLGQFVLAGEPVAAMASQQLASAGAATLVGTTEPVLYVEFRKDGASIDPAPWWAASNPEKVGG